MTEDGPPHYPMKRRHPLAAPDYAAFAGRQPVMRVRLPDESTAWLVLGHEECRRALSHPKLSADSSRPGFPRFLSRPPRLSLAGGGTDPARSNRTFMQMDPPYHDAIRRMLQDNFSPSAVRAMEPMVRRIADGLIDVMVAAGPSADLIGAFAAPFPALVICEILGVPHHDHRMFEQETHHLLSLSESPRRGIRALRIVNDYLDDLIGQAGKEPSDDLIGRLVREFLWTGELQRTELLTTVRLLLMAGLETTASMIGLAFARLLHEPELYRSVRDDPSVIPAAVEELLRFDTIIHHGIRRIATDDVPLGAVTIRPGEGVIICVSAGNRDPKAFDHADRIDFHRKAARGHLSFSGGVHYCLGHILARLELSMALSVVTSAFPDLRLVQPVSELDFREDAFVYGAHALPVTWSPA
jgi:cytochrome P450